MRVIASERRGRRPGATHLGEDRGRARGSAVSALSERVVRVGLPCVPRRSRLAAPANDFEHLRVLLGSRRERFARVRVGDCGARNAYFDAEVRDLGARFRDLGVRLCDFDAEVSDSGLRLRDFDAEVSNLGALLGDFGARRGDTDAEVRDFDAEICDLGGRLRDLKADICDTESGFPGLGDRASDEAWQACLQGPRGYFPARASVARFSSNTGAR